MVLFGINLAAAFNFLFLNSLSGSLICFFGALETVINYLFDRKNIKVPIYIIGLYIIINLILGFSTFKSIIDILPIICALLYCVTICTKEEKNIRKLMFINQFTWLIYDLITKSYMLSISNVLTLISVVISYYRYDIKTKKARR
ncbi:MAG: YgjV family protein [Bacilli bacterium]|nr:YgjV family protein [Bacilli bacterium]